MSLALSAPRTGFPHSALEAAAHPDPYPYYTALLAYRPIYREHRLGLWVAVAAASVSEILASESCRIRPPGEPVPPAIGGAPAGAIFKDLVRMNDGARHASMKAAVGSCLAGFDRTRLAAAARQEAALLLRDLDLADGEGVDAFALALPVRATARLLGLASEEAGRCATLVPDFALCLSPRSGRDEIARANAAASELLSLLRHALKRPLRGGLAMTAERLQSLGLTECEATLANFVGFMSQSWEATAGLIGNTLVALARETGLDRRAANEDAWLRRVIEEVARHDPPIHNTRRFVAEDGVVAGERMKAGEQILCVLAAANRDPALNAHPNRFDPDRPDRHSFTFGAGRHACPGQAIATGIAAAGIQTLLACGLDFAALAAPVGYRRSVNSRIPLFGGSA